MRAAVIRLDPYLPLRIRAHTTDAGLDLCARSVVTLPPGGRSTVQTGFAIALEPGFAGLVVPRSGLAERHGVTVLNAPGIIDSGYRGEIAALLINLDPRQEYRIDRGDRIAQLLVIPITSLTLVETKSLPPSERGISGFGGSGR